MSYRDGDDTERETYRAFRERMQRETPDPTRCAHAMPLATRCIACDDEREAVMRRFAVDLDTAVVIIERGWEA